MSFSRIVGESVGGEARRMLNAALESLDGKMVKEIEHVFYARVARPEELQQAADKEHHEQWSFKVLKTDANAARGEVRVRKTQPFGGELRYDLTVKTDAKDGHRNEVPIPTTVDMFTQFQLFCERGMICDRYRFPDEASGLVWEIDMFIMSDGSYAPWCKVDLEVKDFDAALPSFPIELTDVIVGNRRTMTAQENAFVTELYDKYFLTKNRYLAKRVGGA